ncbi:hypothetical protein FA95DRAFT_620593 [Auriscalpium vulgare]|uniref:Uncharacterized protein n=1 Tax=Auriscalpium vulgare TaxID=40419 RepID=A0ACB8S200_9AGAM|nr:hypothetical protein FA95DRAFT_620593 [Auriscalpium vulgare]
MAESSIEDSLVRLQTHPLPVARDRAVARRAIIAGQTILQTSPLTTALLPAEKGRRCDHCHILQSDEIKLAKCSGCASYWYCGSTCQKEAWSKHHRRVCKVFSRYIATPAYAQLHPHEKMDALLLSQLAAEYPPSANELSSTLQTFISLLSHPAPPSHLPVLPLSTTAASHDVLLSLYSRFGNNNFVLHSHLASFAHGIYPLASRLFNHSCTPNAAVRYSIVREKAVQMDVLALRDILPDEEVCIPYLDPALPLEDRTRALDVSYGFLCACSLCFFQRQLEISPTTEHEFADFVPLLHKFTGCVLSQPPPRHDSQRDFAVMPKYLHTFFARDVLPGLSESFSEASHQGSVAVALSKGHTLLALYLLVYPPNYPQIGLHALELAKTAWNGLITHNRSSPEGRDLVTTVEWYLTVADYVCGVFGSEGDQGGPKAEISLLRRLIKEESAGFLTD